MTRRLLFLLVPVALWSCRGGDLPGFGAVPAPSGYTPAAVLDVPALPPLPAPGADLHAPAAPPPTAAPEQPEPGLPAEPAPAPAVTEPAPVDGAAVTAARVIDGDTFELANGDRVRMIGIDTPERDQCGYREAGAQLAGLIGGRPVVLVPGTAEDRDHHGRLLRYVEVDGRDLNLMMIETGRAVARYDSVDGYGPHPREAAYRAADDASPDANVCG